MWIAALVCLALALIVTLPIWISDRSFGGDIWLHLRLIDQQTISWQETGRPTLTTSLNPVGALSVLPMIFGATLYSIAGLLGALGLGTIGAFCAVTVIVTWMGVFGLWWIARIIGVDGLWAYVPSVVLVSAAFFFGDLLGRGGFSEFAATQSIPLVLAALAEIAYLGRVRVRSAVAILVGMPLLVGSHNISLLWTLTLGIAGALVAWFVAPGVFTRVSRRVAITTAALLLLGSAVAGWAVVPTAIVAGDVQANNGEFNYAASTYFGNPLVWLSPWRWIPPEHEQFWRTATDVGHIPFNGATSLFIQVPVLALLWATWVLVRRRNAAVAQQHLQVAKVIWGFLIGAGILMVFPSIWRAFPRVFLMTQYNFRLVAYVDILVALIVALAVAVWQRTRVLPDSSSRSTVPGVLLLAVVAVTICQSVAQVLGTTNFTHVYGYDVNRGQVTEDPFSAPDWYDPVGPRGRDGPIVAAPKVRLSEDFTAQNQRKWQWVSTVSPGSLVQTPLVTPFDLLEMKGAQPVGRTNTGFVVARVEGPEVAATIAQPWWLVGARVGTLASLLLIGPMILLVLVLDRRRQRGIQPVPMYEPSRRFSQAAVVAAIAVAIVGVVVAALVPQAESQRSYDFGISQETGPSSFVSATGLPAITQVTVPCRVAEQIPLDASRDLIRTSPDANTQIRVIVQRGGVSMGQTARSSGWISAGFPDDRENCQITATIRSRPNVYSLTVGPPGALPVSQNIPTPAAGGPTTAPLPVIAGPASDFRSADGVRVSLKTFATQMGSGQLRAASLMVALLFGCGGLLWLWRRTRERSTLRLAGRPLALSDGVVTVTLGLALFVIPAAFDDGWVLTTVRAFPQLGFFSNFFSAADTVQPQGAWWNAIQVSYLNGTYATPSGILRLASAFFAVITWIFMRRVFIEERLKDCNGSERRSTFVLAVSLYLLGALAWLVTLRPEALVALLVVAVVYLVISYRETQEAFYASSALACAGAALALHQAGFACVIACFGLLKPRVLHQWWNQAWAGRLTRSVVVLGPPLVISGFLVLIPGSISQLNEGRLAFSQSEGYQRILIESARWAELFDGTTNGTNPVRRAMPIFAVLVALAALSAWRRLDNRTKWVVALSGSAWLGLLLTSSKWTWHFGVLAAPSALILALVWPGLYAQIVHRRYSAYALLALVALVSLNAAQGSLDWTQGYDSAVPVADVLPPLMGSRSLLLWLTAAVVGAFFVKRARASQRPLRLAVSLSAMSWLLVFVSIAPVLRDAVRPYSWVRQQAAAVVGDGCGLAAQPVADQLKAVPAFTGSWDAANSVKSQQGGWPTYEGSLTVFGQRGSGGMSATDWYRVTPGAELQGWFKSGTQTSTIEIEFGTLGKTVSSRVVSRYNSGAWLVWTATVPADAGLVRVKWTDPLAAIQATEPLQVSRRTPARDLLVNSVWNNPQSYLQASCFRPVNISGGEVPSLDLAVGVPQWNAFPWTKLQNFVELACPGRVDESASKVCLYGFVSRLAPSKREY